jgi:hypothetical protein
MMSQSAYEALQGDTEGTVLQIGCGLLLYPFITIIFLFLDLNINLFQHQQQQQQLDRQYGIVITIIAAIFPN